MEHFVFFVFLLLVLALVFSMIRSGRGFFQPRMLRWLIVLGAISFYSFWFFQSSVNKFVKNSVALQIINKLPQPVDFYVIKINNEVGKNGKYEITHSGKIRSEHYRIEYLKMEKSDEYWIAGYIGKKNMVYFSQHALPNKNIDQIIEVKNYINQSIKLSETAAKEVEQMQKNNIGVSVWISLGLLLTFLNIVLLLKKKS